MATSFLSLLATFETVVRHGSLKSAAHELSITEGAVSRQLANLTRMLGSPLFLKSGRRLEPTPEAKALARDVRLSNARIDAAIENFRHKHATSVLRVAALPTFATLWLIPRLGQFKAVNPGFSIALVTYTDPNGEALSEGLADVSIEVGRTLLGSRYSRKAFMQDASGPVLATATFSRCGGIGTIEDLVNLPHLRPRSRPDIFKDWCAAAKLPFRPCPTVESFDHVFHTIQAAQAGLGFAIASRCYVEHVVKRGELIAPFGFAARKEPFAAFWRRSLDEDSRIKRFVSWLTSEARRSDGRPQ